MHKRFEHRPNIKTHPKSYAFWMQSVDAHIPDAREILIEKIEEMEEHLIDSLLGPRELQDRSSAQLADAVSCIVEEIIENLCTERANDDLEDKS